jgi:hypothetical protein
MTDTLTVESTNRDVLRQVRRDTHAQFMAVQAARVAADKAAKAYPGRGAEEEAARLLAAETKLAARLSALRDRWHSLVREASGDAGGALRDRLQHFYHAAIHTLPPETFQAIWEVAERTMLAERQGASKAKAAESVGAAVAPIGGQWVRG